MFVVTQKKTGKSWNFKTLYDAGFYVSACVYFNNLRRRNCDRRTNYTIEEKEEVSPCSIME